MTTNRVFAKLAWRFAALLLVASPWNCSKKAGGGGLGGGGQGGSCYDGWPPDPDCGCNQSWGYETCQCQCGGATVDVDAPWYADGVCAQDVEGTPCSVGGGGGGGAGGAAGGAAAGAGGTGTVYSGCVVTGQGKLCGP